MPGIVGSIPVSEYQLTYAIMMFTLATSTLDLMYAYQDTVSFPIFAILYVGSVVQLTARLLLFCTILSLETEGDRTTVGTLVILAYFAGSFVVTMSLTSLFNWLGLYSGGKTMTTASTQATEYRVHISVVASEHFLLSSHGRNSISAELHYHDKMDSISVSPGWKSKLSGVHVGMVKLTSRAPGPRNAATHHVRGIHSITLRRSSTVNDADGAE
eukprot:SAG31_NODE_806_length_11957_cov_2.232670_7_plen_214_part_00